MSVLSKIQAPVERGPEAEFCFEDEEFAQRWPGIFEVLARLWYEGEKRLPGRLVLFCEPGKASLCLCDKASGQVAFYTSGSFLEALEGLEGQLQDGGADWRKDKRHWRG